MLNRWIASGRVEENPTLREGFLKTGDPIHISEFTLIIDRGRENYIDEIKCVCFEHIADYAHNYIRAGDIIFVEGQLQTAVSSKTGKKKKNRLSVAIRDIEVIYRNGSARKYDNFAEIKDKMIKAFSDDNSKVKPKRGAERQNPHKPAETAETETQETETQPQDLWRKEAIDGAESGAFMGADTDTATERNADIKIPF